MTVAIWSIGVGLVSWVLSVTTSKVVDFSAHRNLKLIKIAFFITQTG